MEGEDGVALLPIPRGADSAGVQAVGGAVGTPVGLRPVALRGVVGEGTAIDSADHRGQHPPEGGHDLVVDVVAEVPV